MVSVGALWLPIVLAAVVVFAASSVIHMFLPWHRGDFRRLPAEDALRRAIRDAAGTIPPGDYMTPYASSMKEAGTPEHRAKYQDGPVAILTVYPNQDPTMGRQLALWFVYCLVVSLFAAYLAGAALGPGAHYLGVFRMAGTAAFLGYGMALMQGSIWYGRQWGTTLKSMVDALLYGLLTGGVFGWMWPA